MKCIQRYCPVTLLPEEKRLLESNLAHHHEALVRAAHENNNDGDVRTLRNEYKKGIITFAYDCRAKRAMNFMIANESLVIGVFIRLAVNPCKRFHRTNRARPGVVFDDYIQQCADCIYDCMYLYDGSQRFATYVSSAMTRRLIDFTKIEQRQLGGCWSIRRLHLAIKQIMAELNCRFETALDRLRMSEDIDDKTADKLRDSMRCHFDIKDHLGEAVVASEFDSEGMMLAIDRANLKPKQRKAIEAFMTGDRKWHVIFREAYPICEKTGEPYSKQRIGQFYKQACDIVRRTYAAMSKKLAA